MNELQKAIEFGLAGKYMEQYYESFHVQISKKNRPEGAFENCRPQWGRTQFLNGNF